MMRRTILYQVILIVLGLFPLLSRAETYTVNEISHLEINSAISPATYDYLQHHFKHLPDGSLILIKLNTPGGLISTTKDIITLIGKQPRPVVVWITPEGASAASAGAIIASAAHFIVMSSGTNMGAATPVGLGEDIKEKDGRSKALNDLKAMVRSLSQSRGRPAGPFEEMIESAKSFTDQEALKLKIIDGVVTHKQTLRDLINHKTFSLQGKPMELEFASEVLSKNYEPSLGQKILNVLANPSTAYLLFLIGLALVYFEFQAPGGFIAGGVGISFLVMAAIAFQILPLDWGAFALILVGVVLLILEIYVTSYGLLALAGLGSFIGGSLFLFHDEEGFISINHTVLISSLLGILVSVGVIGWFAFKSRKKGKDQSSFFGPMGAKGIVMTKDGSLYQIKVGGEIWRATSPWNLNVGEEVEVTSVDTNKLIAEVKKTHKE